MKILHLCHDDIRGGAARAAYRLHEGLQKIGEDSVLAVEDKTSQDRSVVALPLSNDWPSRIRRKIQQQRIKRDYEQYRRNRPDGYDNFSDDRSLYGSIPPEQLPPCDVINLHWISQFIDPICLVNWSRRKIPLVWTLHDMNAFTGGCHYDDGCGRFTKHCGECPQLAMRNENDLSAQIWKRKVARYGKIAHHHLHLVTPSRWLAREAQRSSLLQAFPITVIPYGLDGAAFFPQDRSRSRTELGIPADATVILFVAGALGNKRKGLPQLLAALERLAGSAPFLLSIGKGELMQGDSFSRLHLGEVHGDERLSKIYSAADIYVIASSQDNLPNTVLESLACGTPVVGFNIGGIPDMVRPMQTGLLAKAGDVDDLAKKIKWLIDHPQDRLRMGRQAREFIEEEFTLKLQAERYRQLYRSLLSKS